MLRTFIDNFEVFTHNDKVLSSRLLISLGLPDPYINEESMESIVSFQIFERFNRTPFILDFSKSI